VPETPEIGERIKRLRLSRDLTLKALERKAQVSATHISEIERGLTSPTVGAFQRIARALDVSPGRLIAGDATPRISVVRRSERRALMDVGAGARLQSLAGRGGSARMSIVEIEIDPGRDRAPLRVPHPGEEIVHVLRGVVEVATSSGRHLLQEGDTLHQRPDPGRTFRNFGDGSARMLWITTPRSGF